MRAPAHVRRAHQLSELSATRLELLLTALRQGAREHEALRLFEVFAELAPSELAWVQRHLRWERVDGGSLLVQQGQLADALWLLRAGKLEVLRETNGAMRHLASLGPGSVVGEAAVLAGTAHVTSVRALRDSTVARLDREVVNSLMQRSVGFARVMARIVARDFATRSFGESAPGVRKGRTIAVIPLATPERVRRFVADLAQAMQGEGSVTMVVDTDRLDSALGANASKTRRGVVEILYHAMAIPSFHQQAAMERLGERDNVCILTPPLGGFGLFGANAAIGKQLERAAWEYAVGELRGVAKGWKERRGGWGFLIALDEQDVPAPRPSRMELPPS